MPSATGRRTLSFLIVGLLLLSGFVALNTATFNVRAATSIRAVQPSVSLVDQPSIVGSPIAEPARSGSSENSWQAKLAPSLKDSAIQGSKALQDVIVYTQDMKELAPLLGKYGVKQLPEPMDAPYRRASVQSDIRVRAVGEGIVSTRTTVPAYAIAEIAKLPGVLGIERAPVLAPAITENLDLQEARQQVRDFKAQAESSGGIVPSDWGVVRSQGVVDASGNYPAYTGAGVYVAVQDEGVDFAHPNLVGQWATVQDPTSPYFGYPIMLSQHSMYNNLELFTASSDLDRYPYPILATFGTATWYSDTTYQALDDGASDLIYSTGVNYGLFQVTKRLAPDWASCSGSTSLISRTYYVGLDSDGTRIPTASGWYHLGIAKDMYLEGYYCERVGILVTDPTTPFDYDTVYVDLNDNYDFTDDPAVTIGSPLSAIDINGDGFNDISGGLLYFIGKRTGSVTDEVVIAAATGTETSASLAAGWIETDVEGYATYYTATMALDGMYWPSSGEDIWEPILPDTTGLGDETGTTAQLTLGYNAMTGAPVDTATLLVDYDLRNIYDIYNNSGSLVEGVDYSINMDTGLITWLVDFPDGDFVDIIYEFNTWRVDYDSGAISFSAPPIAGSLVTATYNTGLPVPYANITARRQGWDLFVPGPGDLVAFHGAFELTSVGWHGTSVASNLAGRAVGNFFGILDIWGTAPDAKIISATIFPSVDTAEIFEFSMVGYDGVRGNGDDANIATNSWGFTTPHESGFTDFERFLYDMTTSRAPDMTIVFSAGNEGPGYGTVSPPGSGPGILTVGAGTLMNYRWLFGFDLGNGWYDWPLVGSGPFGVGPFGDIVDFSSKGPTLMGTPEPDVYAVGANAFGAKPLNWACLPDNFDLCDGANAWDLWAGTSLSTPITAGVVAGVYQAYASVAGAWPDSATAKEIIMSSADDKGYDVLQQGAGWVNATKAYDLAAGVAGVRISPGYLTPGGYGGVHRPAFVNMIRPGSSATETLTAYNPTASDQTLTIGDASYVKVGADYTFAWDFATPFPGRDWRILKPSGLYAVDGHTVLDPIDLSVRWNAADFLRLTFVRDYATSTGVPYSLIELFDWWDEDGNGTFAGVTERTRFSFWDFEGSRWSQIAEVYDPANRIHDGMPISMRDFANTFGTIFVTVEFYGKADWAWADAQTASGLVVPAGGFATFDVAFSVPAGTPAGMYQGAIWVSTGGRTSLVPVVITVPSTGLAATYGGGTPATSLYENNGIGEGCDFAGCAPSEQVGDSRFFWADFTNVPAANQKMIYNLLLQEAPSEADLLLFTLAPDAVWSDDAIYGPGTMSRFASTSETPGSTNTNVLYREFMATDVLTSGPLALKVEATDAATSSEPFRLEVGIMTVNPQIALVSTNKLVGSVPVTVSASVPLYDGVAMVGFQQLPGNGLLDSLDPILTSSTTATATESVTLTNLADNTYFIAVHGWSVPAGTSTFDMTVSTTTAAGTTVDTYAGLTILQDNPSNPYTASFVQARSLVGVTRFQVDVSGQSGDDIDLYVMSDAPRLVIGGGAFSGVNGPTSDVAANTGAPIDLAWTFPADKREGVTTDIVYVSPGFAPVALAYGLPIRFSYDLTAPTFSSPLPSPGSTGADSTPPVFVQIDDPQRGAIAPKGEIDDGSIRLWLDGVDVTPQSAVTVPFQNPSGTANDGYNVGSVLFVPSQPLEEGWHTAIALAGDFAGNLRTTSWSFRVDTAAPGLQIASPINGLATSAASIVVSGVTEPGASVTVAGQLVPVDDTGGFSATVALSPGTNAIEVTATDAVGNVASTTVTVVRDNAAPAISLLRSSSGLLTNKDVTVISGAVSEPASVTVAGTDVMVHADGSFEAPVALVEGSNAIDIVATDAAGNAGTATVTVVRDMIAPSVTLDALPAETANPTVTVTGTVESGVAFVTVNGQPVVVTSGRYSTDVALSFGPNEIFVTATDGAGNSETVSAAVSYVPTGVTTATVGLILLPVVAVVAMLIGLALGQWMQGRKPGGGMKEKEKTEPAQEPGPQEEEELPPEGGVL